MSSRVTNSFPRQAVTDGHDQHPALVVEDPHVQLVGAERQSGHQRVHPLTEQRLARFATPGQMQGAHIGVRIAVAQFANRGGDDETGGVPDGDPAGLGGFPGLGRGIGGGAQQRLGAGQEECPGIGELAALRGAVDQAGTHLLFEVADLPAQGRLGDVQGLGGAAEVPVLGDHREVPH